MSRRPLSTPLTLMRAAIAATACSDHHGIAPQPLSSRAGGGPGSQGAPAIEVASSVGWQEQARPLAAAAKMSPLASARVYAALSVAEYRATMAIPNPEVGDGLPPEIDVGTRGRRLLENGGDGRQGNR